MHFVDATDANLAELAELVRGFYAEEPAMPGLSDREARAKAAKILSLAPAATRPLFIRQSGQTLGYALLCPYFSNEFGGMTLLLDELFIVHERRSRGLGGNVLEMLKNWAVDQGYPCVLLEVTDANASARKLYERHGFVALPRVTMAWARE